MNESVSSIMIDPPLDASTPLLSHRRTIILVHLAKAREEGGRFSVTDIELAMRTIGDSSNKKTFLSSLNRTGLELLRPAIENYLDSQSIANPDLDPKLPKRLQFLQDDLEYYDNPNKREVIRKQEQKEKLEKEEIIIPPLNPNNPQPINI